MSLIEKILHNRKRMQESPSTQTAKRKQTEQTNPGDSEIEAKAAQLLNLGYVVITAPPCCVDADRKSFDSYCRNIPELKSPLEKTGDKGIGSFGAINYASAFHHPCRIQCDQTINIACKPVLEKLAAMLGLEYLTQIPDRFIYRTKSQSQSSWHTDNTAGAKQNDCFFGAHYNLNDMVAQTFTCAPRNHSTKPRLEGGEYTPSDAATIEKFNKIKEKVQFSPGEILLHFENIPHLAGSKVTVPVKRKIGAFRLSNHNQMWMPKNKKRLETQSALIYKGGEEPCMYAKLHLTNWPEKLQEFAGLLIDECVEEYTYNSGKKEGLCFTFPKKYPPSLQSIGKRYKYDDNLKECAMHMFDVHKI